MTFWDFFGWYVLAKLLWVLVPIALVFALIAAVYLAGGLGLQGGRLMNRVWTVTGPDEAEVFRDDDRVRAELMQTIERERRERDREAKEGRNNGE